MKINDQTLIRHLRQRFIYADLLPLLNDQFLAEYTKNIKLTYTEVGYIKQRNNSTVLLIKVDTMLLSWYLSFISL